MIKIKHDYLLDQTEIYYNLIHLGSFCAETTDLAYAIRTVLQNLFAYLNLDIKVEIKE